MPPRLTINKFYIGPGGDRTHNFWLSYSRYKTSTLPIELQDPLYTRIKGQIIKGFRDESNIRLQVMGLIFYH